MDIVSEREVAFKRTSAIPSRPKDALETEVKHRTWKIHQFFWLSHIV